MVNLEVGKSYRNREGDIVVIEKFVEGCVWPYESSGGERYRPGGHFLEPEDELPEDLVEEIIFDPIAVSPEAAKSIDNASPADWDALTVQVGGSHYKTQAIQPLEFCMANNYNQCQASIVKYVDRYKRKGGKEDLEKAKHYIDLLIHFEYPEAP